MTDWATDLAEELAGMSRSRIMETDFLDSDSAIYLDRRTGEPYSGRQARAEVFTMWRYLSNNLLKRF